MSKCSLLGSSLTWVAGGKWDGGAGVQRFLQTYSASAKEKWDWAAAAQVQSSYSLLCVVDPWHFLLIPPTHGAVFFSKLCRITYVPNSPSFTNEQNMSFLPKSNRK